MRPWPSPTSPCPAATASPSSPTRAGRPRWLPTCWNRPGCSLPARRRRSPGRAPPRRGSRRAAWRARRSAGRRGRARVPGGDGCRAGRPELRRRARRPRPTGAGQPGGGRRGIRRRCKRTSRRPKPVVACLMGDISLHEAFAAAHRLQIPAYTFPEDAVRAFGALWQRRQVEMRLAAQAVSAAAG